METISSISDFQSAVKEELENNTYFVNHRVPILIENAKDIEYQIKTAMSSLGITATVATPSLTYKGDVIPNEKPCWEVSTLNVVVVENPTLNRGRADYATALDTALQIALTLNRLPNVGIATISQNTQGGLVVVTVSAKTHVSFSLEFSEEPAQ